MAHPNKNIEIIFLKIFKGTVLLIMGLALISILFLCLNAAYQLSQKPIKPVPVQSAPEKDPVKEINIGDLKQFLLDREKQETSRQIAPKQQESQQASLLFLEDATALYRCSADFGKKIGAIIENADDTQNLQQVNKFRYRLERIADSPLLGETWVKAANPFICNALADESIIALKKEGKVKTIFFPMLEFHAEAWKKIQNEKLEFEKREENRVKNEWEAELNRVRSAESSARQSLIAAGFAFGTFMFLALYLIIAKIENNLRDINVSISKFERLQK